MNSNQSSQTASQQPESATQQVIAFLSNPEVSLADPAELPLLLADPDELHQAVKAQLETPRAVFAEEAASLKARLNEVDWPHVAREFQSRLDLAAGFFDPDAQAHDAS